MSKSIFKKIGLSFALLLLLTGGVLTFIFTTNNIHTVIPAQVYRSAQLTPEELTETVKKYNIKSIVNLRHISDEPWYQREVATAQKLDVDYYNVPLAAQQFPSEDNFNDLVKVIQTAPKPILFHCKRGADRTGLASAMSTILLENADLATASKQTGMRYLVFSSDSVGKLVLSQYEDWLTKTKLNSSKASFIMWLDTMKKADNAESAVKKS